MIIHSQNHVTELDDKCIQPNAVDIRINELIKVEGQDFAVFIHEQGGKQFFPQKNIDTEPLMNGNYFRLDPRTTYLYETKHRVTIPNGMVGWQQVRSTLARNGLIITGGLYDAGYSGFIGGQIHNMTDGTVFIEHNCRIAQFIMSASETSHLYDGHYNKTEGRSIA